MPEEYDSVRARADGNLIDFLKVELNVGFAFAKLAKTRRDMGRHEHYKRDRLQALKAVESVKGFEGRIRDDDARKAIQDRCKQLEEVIDTLTSQPPRSALSQGRTGHG